MKVGVPRETWPGENRVALIPSAAAALKKSGLDVVVERDAGLAAGFPSGAYEQAGATVGTRDAVFSTADIILQVRSVPPETGRLRKGQVVIGFADPLGAPDAIPPRWGPGPKGRASGPTLRSRCRASARGSSRCRSRPPTRKTRGATPGPRTSRSIVASAS